MGFEITSELIALLSIISTTAIAIFSIYFGPRLLEKSKRKGERETRLWRQSEERFFSMLSNLGSFYEGSISFPLQADKRKLFIEAYNHIWLYSSDESIRKVNNFLVSIGYSKEIETPQDEAAREMIYAMRKAVFGDTKLKQEEFLFASTK